MKHLAILLPLLLSGCLTLPVERRFPDVPDELKVACPDLKQVNDTTKLSEVVKIVTDNYTQYHECQYKVDIWIDWYKTQKQIFEDVK
jgi:hypothetical protein